MRDTYVREADLMRAIAIIGVILVHVTSVPVVKLSPDSSLYPVYLALNIFGALAVPTFIFLNGFLLFYSYCNKVPAGGWVLDYYRKKLTYIVLPYVCWSLFYCLFSLFLRGSREFDLLAFARQLYIGRAYYHLYFMVIIIQFYLLFPLLLAVVRKVPTLTRHLAWLGLLVQWAFYFYNRYYWQFQYKSRLSLTYFSFFMFGAFVAMNYDKLLYRRGELKKYLPGALVVWLGTLAWYFVLYYNTYAHKIQASGVWFELAWTAYAFSSFIFLYVAAGTILVPATLSLLQLGRVSFGVYLVHPMLLSSLRQLPISSKPALYHFTLVAQFAVVLLSSWLFVYLLQKYFPASDLILGRSKIRTE